tara:strand:- start:928 stop:1194 length:267 start_codon:yes stop_codon:yes gene_type:complete
MTDEKAKDLALVTCIILEEDLLGGTLWESFDVAYKLAKEFCELYPSDYNWEGFSDLDFDEAVIDFVREKNAKDFYVIKKTFKPNPTIK